MKTFHKGSTGSVIMEELMNQDFGKLSNCSKNLESDIRAMNWIRVSIAATGFVIVMIILLIVVIRREVKTVIERLFIYLLVSTLLRQISLFSNVEHQFEYQSMDKVCNVLGALDLYTAFLVMFYAACSVIYLLSRAVEYKPFHQKSKRLIFEIAFVFSTFVLPFILSLGLIPTNLYGLSIAWCWVREYDDNCQHTNILKKVFGGYTLLLGTGILSIILTIPMVVMYCKIARKVKKATHFLHQATILIICLILNVLVIFFSSLVTALTPTKKKYIVAYTYTVVIALYDLIYPLGFLAFLKYQNIMICIRNRQRRSQYIPIARSCANATVSPSDRVSARSTTVPVTLPYTGDFTNID